jgi:signal transduction histidine kinase
MLFRSLILCALSFSLGLVAAEVSLEELSKEAEAKCQATATDKPTPALIVQKVKAAAALVAQEGTAAFGKFRGKDSEFIFGGTYIWIHNTDGKMLMHPVKPKMEGRDLLGLKDANGKTFFVDMNVAAAAGGGWVDYVWPKPGSKEPSQKVSYVVQAKHGEDTFVVGCGVYDLTMDEIAKSGAK